MSQENLKGAQMTAWYVSKNGEASGPFATDMVLSMLRQGQLLGLDLVFREGEIEWRPAASFRELKLEVSASLAGQKASDKAVQQSPSQSFEPSSGVSSAGDSHGHEGLTPNRTQSSAGALDSRGARALSWIVLRPHSSTYLQEGPFDTQAIIDGLQVGRFQFSQYAWHVGMNQWMRIGDLREFDRRSRSRESKPHVPPPLPDPIAAVLLEDDGDSEAEEFHITMRGLAKHDVTPNPLDSMQALKAALSVNSSSAVGIGGAAAESPEDKSAQQKANKAASLVSTPNLAGVPWEQDVSDGYAASVELIDDENSGIDLRHDRTPAVEPQIGPDSGKVTDSDGLTQLDQTPLPFLPPVSRRVVKDAWTKWGRHAAAGVQALVALVFFAHLVTTPAESLRQKPAVKLDSAPDLKSQQAASPQIESVEKQSASDLPVGQNSGQSNGQSNGQTLSVVSGPQVPAASLSDFNIVGLKLDRPDGQLVIQGSVPLGVPIAVTFKGRLGQILSKMSVRKTVSVSRKGGELPTLKLTDLKLPAGAYTVEVDAGGARTRNEIFIGTRDKKFLDRLETHLREISFETQSQKKALFYAAKELDILARDLAQNYGQLRTKPEQWSAFFKGWNKKVETVQRTLADIGKKTSDDQAYPEETAQLFQAFTSLNDVASQYDQATRQSRDIASDALAELISELSRQKAAIGEATARPTADTPDGML